jgi:predicted enzyme related to lactoylglutathione lyase
MPISVQKIVALGVAFAAANICAQAQPAPSPDVGPPAFSALTMMTATVPTRNLEKSLDFYIRGLGLAAMPRIEQPNVTEAPLSFPGGGTFVMLMYPKSKDTVITPRGSLTRLVLGVPDLQALEARLKGAGYALKSPIMNLPQYKAAVSHVEDPDGNQIELIQRID